MPLGELGLEVLLGLGVALFAANAWILLRPVVARWTNRQPPPPRYRSTGVVVALMLAGAVLGAWALASLIRG
jgi:hypothetical protein